MSYIIPFLTSPLGYARQAYLSANFELPLTAQTSPRCPPQYISRNDPEYGKGVQELCNKYIKKIIRPFLDKQNIRRDLLILEKACPVMCMATGTQMFKDSDAVIILAPGLHDTDEEACRCIIKHEVCHIKHNDTFTIPLIASICSTAAAIFGVFTMLWFSATLFTILVGTTTFALFAQWREAKADDFAMENSSNEELLGGRRFLMAQQKSNLNTRQSLLKKIEISARGDNRFDILHPSLTSRIQKVEKKLAEKHIPINDAQEDPKIAKLEEFISSKTRMINACRLKFKKGE